MKRAICLVLVLFSAFVSFVTEGRQAITWTNVSPPGVSLGPDPRYGAQVILLDNANPLILYAFLDFEGVFKSTDAGLNWTKITSGSTAADQGKLWGAAIAQDGSYMLTVAGTGPDFNSSLRSTNKGVSWTVGQVTSEPYGFDISPYDVNHVIMSTHDDNHMWESLDGGVTWTDKGDMGTSSGQSSYVWFGLNDNTAISTGDGDTGTANGTWRGVKSAGSWTWTQVSDQQHWHGSHQLFRDTVNNWLLNPGARGVDKSTDNGVNWTRVTTSSGAGISATPLYVYIGNGYASNGNFAPNFIFASRNPATSFSATSDPNPTGMGNGPRWMTTTCDGTNYVIVTANWSYGIWRAVTAETCFIAPPNTSGGRSSFRIRR